MSWPLLYKSRFPVLLRRRAEFFLEAAREIKLIRKAVFFADGKHRKIGLQKAEGGLKEEKIAHVFENRFRKLAPKMLGQRAFGNEGMAGNLIKRQFGGEVAPDVFDGMNDARGKAPAFKGDVFFFGCGEKDLLQFVAKQKPA